MAIQAHKIRIMLIILKTQAKGVWTVYIDTYSKISDVKLYEDKTACTSLDMLNYRIIPWYLEQGVPILRILTDHGTEYKNLFTVFLLTTQKKRIHHL